MVGYWFAVVVCGGCALFYTGAAFGSCGKVLFCGLLLGQISVLRCCCVAKFVFVGLSWLFACPFIYRGYLGRFCALVGWVFGVVCRSSSYIAACHYLVVRG